MQNGEDEIVFSHLAGLGDIELSRQAGQLFDIQFPELAEVQLLPFLLGFLLNRTFLLVRLAIHESIPFRCRKLNFIPKRQKGQRHRGQGLGKVSNFLKMTNDK